MKGFNISSFETVSNAIALCKLYKSLGCDTIRWQFNAPFPGLLLDRTAYRTWLMAEINKLTEVIFAVPGLVYIPDLHSTFGGVNDWTNEHYMLEGMGFLQWKEDVELIEKAYRDVSQVIGIDVVNEPWVKPVQWRRFLDANTDWLRKIASSKKVYINTPYGNPSRLKFIPKLDRQVIPSVHIWPLFSLRTTEEEVLGDAKMIESEGALNDLREVRAYEVATRRRVMIGELGCAYGVGPELQRKYMKKALRYCVKNKMQVCVHGEAGNPAYRYEQNGILGIVADVFRGK